MKDDVVGYLRVSTEPAPETVALGYVRVSTERQAADVYSSLRDQSVAIEALAVSLDVAVGAWYRDEGVSGGTADRPAFSELVRYCQAHSRPRSAPGYVLVLNTSRFGRFDDPEEAAYWRHMLRRSGWLVRFAEGDAEGDAATIIRAVGDVEASTYRRNLRRNTIRGKRGTAKQGFWQHHEPFGYRRMVVFPPGSERVLARGQQKAKTEKVKLTPHADEAAVVRSIFADYAAGATSGSIARALKVEFPVMAWAEGKVMKILHNPAYVGDVVGGQRKGESYGMANAHEPIVSRELFDAVQQRALQNKKLGKGTRTTYVLSGLMRCADCGVAYVGGGGCDAEHRSYREGAHYCRDKRGTVLQSLIEPRVINVLADVIGSPEVVERLEREIDRILSSAAENAGAVLSQLRARLAGLVQKRDRLVAMIAEGTLLPHEAAAQVSALRSEIEVVEQRIEAARFSGRRGNQAQTERDALVRVALDFPALARRVSGPTLRRLIEPWLHALTFDKHERVVDIAISPLPALGVFLPDYGSASGVREYVPTVRRIQLPRITDKRKPVRPARRRAS